MEQTRSAKLHHRFVGDGHYDLCLRIDELIALQETLGVGPFVAANRLLSGEWMVGDVRETIRLGLIGGGMHQHQAFKLVDRYVKEGYLIEYAALAGEVIFAAMSGVEDEPIAGEAAAPAATTEDWTSLNGVMSFDPLEPWDTHHEK